MSRFSGAIVGMLVGSLLFYLLFHISALMAFSMSNGTGVFDRKNETAYRAIIKGWNPHISGQLVFELVTQRTEKPFGTCPSIESRTWRDSEALQISLVQFVCPSSFLATKQAAGYKGVLITDSALPQPNGVYRYADVDQVQYNWRENNVTLVLIAGCPEGYRACGANTLEMVRELGTATKSLPVQDPTKNPLGNLLLGPFFVWLAFLGPVRTLTVLLRRRWASTQGKYYTDLSDEVSRVHRHWLLSRVLMPVAMLFLFISILETIVVPSAPIILGLLASLGALISMRLLTRPGKWAHSSFPRKWAPGGGSEKLSNFRRTRVFRRPFLAAAAAWSGYVLVVGATCLYMLAGITTLGLANGSFRRDEAIRALYQSRLDSFLEEAGVVFAFAVIGQQYSPELGFAIFFAPIVAIAFLFFRLSRRLSAPSASDQIGASGGRYVLYLRGFDEDKLRIPSPSLRSGLVERVMPFRKRNFEEVLVAALSAHAPVVALADPQSRLPPPLGAAKNIIRSGDWFKEVEEQALGAECVVVSGTPASVREGFGKELDFIALGRVARVLVIQAPWSHRKLPKRWSAFTAYTQRKAYFEELSSGNWPPGTHVLARTNCGSWRGWGCRVRTDVSYRLAIGQAFNHLMSDSTSSETGSSAVYPSRLSVCQTVGQRLKRINEWVHHPGQSRRLCTESRRSLLGYFLRRFSMKVSIASRTMAFMLPSPPARRSSSEAFVR